MIDEMPDKTVDENIESVDIMRVQHAATDCFVNAYGLMEYMKKVSLCRQELTEIYMLKRKQLKELKKNFLSLDEDAKKKLENELDVLDNIAVKYRKRQQQLLDRGYDWLKCPD